MVLYRDNKVPTLSWSIEFLPRYLISSFDKKKQSTEKRLQLATTESELCRPSPWVYCFSELDLVLYRDDRAPTLSWSIEFLPRHLISYFDKKKQSTEKRLQLATTESELCRPSPWVYCFSELDLVLYRDDRVPTLSWSIEFLPRHLISYFDKKKQSTEKRLQLATTESELCRPSPWVYCFSELDLDFYRDNSTR